ncbi:MAG: hypothetical protein ACRDO2_07900 [Nocardioidaceae bacterium]
MSGRRVSAVALLALVLAVAAGLMWWQRGDDETRFEEALATLPAQTEIVSYTDWTAAQAAVQTDAAGSSSVRTKQAFLDAAYERDVSAVSLLAISEADVYAAYGVSVLDAEWEIYGQSPAGAVEMLRMSDEFDFEALDSRLTDLGYAEADATGVRQGGADLVAAIGAGLTPQLAHVALLPDEGLIVASDAADFAARAVSAATGDEASLGEEGRVRDMATSLGDGPVAATVLVGARTCDVAGFADADPGTRAVVRQRIEEAGGVSRLDGLALALVADGSLTLAMHVATGNAEADLEARQVLATGEAPGQGGTFEERFTVTEASADEGVLTMRLDPADPDERLLSDLGRGSLLPAVC